MAIWEDGFVVMDRVVIHSDYRLARVSVSGEPIRECDHWLTCTGKLWPAIIAPPDGTVRGSGPTTPYERRRDSLITAVFTAISLVSIFRLRGPDKIR